ncbi:MAG: prephenate dehydrogenase [Sulfurovaceae bacterium]|nr:prephenate dehydrogenase [Sulfurovaceae bacterium]
MGVRSIGIVGLGLMGGSIGLSLKKLYPQTSIVGYDHNLTHIKEAKDLNLVDRLADNIEEIWQCDLAILAIPVDSIISIIKQINNISQNTTIIDMGSTKKLICDSIPDAIRSNFVATHPMTGTEKSGPTAAIDGLYNGKTVVLCDVDKSGEHQQEVVKNLYEALGMNIIYMDSTSHDQHAAFISHMPHAISYALANTVMRQEDPKSIVALAGGGFRDMSRIAKSSPVMWESIFRQNRINVLDSVKHFKQELDAFEKMLNDENWDGIKKWMTDANSLHDIL